MGAGTRVSVWSTLLKTHDTHKGLPHTHTNTHIRQAKRGCLFVSAHTCQLKTQRCKHMPTQHDPAGDRLHGCSCHDAPGHSRLRGCAWQLLTLLLSLQHRAG